MELNRWWAASLVVNRALCGSASEPLCSRVYRQRPSAWRSAFMFCADLLFGEPYHCAQINRRWRLISKGETL